MSAVIGIRREDKNPWEKRVPLIPSHAAELAKEHSLEIVIQPSSIRIFTDEDYAREGIKVDEDLSPCSVVFALKEIPLHLFQKEKAYMFFSHTIKGQPHNMPMLKKMIEMECTMIDYEKVVNERGQRLLFFGREAGLAGMIDTLWALGKRFLWETRENPFSRIEKAMDYASLVEAKEEIQQVGWKIYQEGLHPSLVPFVCGFTGYGHVSQGAQEIFDLLPFDEIAPEGLDDFLKQKNFSSNKLYKVVFKEQHMVKPVSPGENFELQDYYQNPHKYAPVFESYLEYFTVIVNCIYWEPKYPRFVTKKYLRELFKSTPRPRLRVIGDITCDIEGAVECTVKATNPDKPVYTYDPISNKVTDGYGGRGTVVMAVDNLPAEIALESSTSFSTALKPFVPAIAAGDFSGDFTSLSLPEEIERAVILYRGKFTPDYTYMEEFL